MVSRTPQQTSAYFMRQAHRVGDLIAFTAVEDTALGDNSEPMEVDAQYLLCKQEDLTRETLLTHVPVSVL